LLRKRAQQNAMNGFLPHHNLNIRRIIKKVHLLIAGRWLLRDQHWTTLDYPTAARDLDYDTQWLLALVDHPAKQVYLYTE
jgi:hypothetical protein